MANLTIKDAAERCGLSTGLLYQFCAGRRLPHFRLGREGKRGKILIEEAGLEAFLAPCKVETGADVAPTLRHIIQQ